MLSKQAYQRICDQLQARDQACIPLIYDNYGDALYGIIYRIVGREEDAAEILQDTFVKIWKNGATYDPERGRLFTWMVNIARNLAINRRNSKGFRQQTDVQTDEKLVYLSDESRGTVPETVDVKGMLQKIDKKYQTVISLLYLQGYTQQEVSDRLQIPLGTVKSRVKIGLRELRKWYDFDTTAALLSAFAFVD
ncbi:MAG: sigma-70 family RNA polymerase sigma factor [Bacteroidota bacterium]